MDISVRDRKHFHFENTLGLLASKISELRRMTFYRIKKKRFILCGKCNMYNNNNICMTGNYRKM